MTAANFDACFAQEMIEEGGWSDNPDDPGKATNWGVTQATWQTFVGASKVVTVADIKALTQADVLPLYRVFWRGCNANYLPDGVDLVTFDWCVNSGVGRGNEGLQQALGVTVDGLVGPKTLNAATSPSMDRGWLIDKVCDLRQAFYRKQLDFSEFGDGWLDRVVSIRAAAHAMVSRL